jgi:hypothetical protein
MAQAEKNGVVQPIQYDIVRWSLLKNIWPFLVALFIMGGAWVSNTVEVTNLRKDFNTLNVRYEQHLVDVVTIKAERDEQYRLSSVAFAEILKELTFIKVQLEQHMETEVK